MDRLNLPTYSFNIKSKGERKYIFDEIRKIYVVLTPEEWVRQHFIRYLMAEKGCPESLIGVEVHFRLNRLSKRGDIVVYGRDGLPMMLVECKSPRVRINQEVFDQAARYNMKLRVEYLAVTNGMEHYCSRLDQKSGSYQFLDEIPSYDVMDRQSGSRIS